MVVVVVVGGAEQNLLTIHRHHHSVARLKIWEILQIDDVIIMPNQLLLF